MLFRSLHHVLSKNVHVGDWHSLHGASRLAVPGVPYPSALSAGDASRQLPRTFVLFLHGEQFHHLPLRRARVTAVACLWMHCSACPAEVHPRRLGRILSFSHDRPDRIDNISVGQITLIPLVDGGELDGVQLRFRAGLPWSECLAIMDAMLASRNLSRDQVAVDHLQIRIRLRGDGEHRGKSLTIRISPQIGRAHV